jgi:hypothetical protein
MRAQDNRFNHLQRWSWKIENKGGNSEAQATATATPIDWQAALVRSGYA